jgi:hypothetical protein
MEALGPFPGGGFREQLSEHRLEASFSPLEWGP